MHFSGRYHVLYIQFALDGAERAMESAPVYFPEKLCEERNDYGLRLHAIASFDPISRATPAAWGPERQPWVRLLV